MKKKVILMIIDALNSRTFFQAIDDGKLPHFKQIHDRGQVKRESVSIFPSLTPAATSTIITGKYPREHQVFGFHWYDREHDEIAYYGDDFWAIAKLGFGDFFNGCLWQLNQERLSSDTIFEKLHGTGLHTASLNFLMFRGPTPHVATVPGWFSWHPEVPFAENLSGPNTLFFGDFVDSSYQFEGLEREARGGPLGRFGFNDENTGELLCGLAERDELPEFTLAYFPDHDYRCHEKGPELGVEAVVAVDDYLGRLFEALGGVEKTLEQYVFVISGDHAQSDVLDDADKAVIKVSELLKEFEFSNTETWDNGDVLKVFPDMRCAQIYFRYPETDIAERVRHELLQEERIDQLLWREGDLFRVATADRGELTFRRAAEGRGKAVDCYGNSWTWSGELATVDGRIEDGQLHFEDYPNAFERIEGGLRNRDSGDLWMTAKIGYEFANHESESHLGGGSHGSLHRLDSMSPLLVSDPEVRLPDACRLVDLEPICRSILESAVDDPEEASQALVTTGASRAPDSPAGH